MDGLFLSGEDIIGTANSDTYKSFNLDDEWGVSPVSTQFSLRSPELNFTDQNFLEKVASDEGKEITVKQEVKEERCSSPADHWFSVLENKQIWKENARNSFDERYLSAEQVVPDQVNGMESSMYQKREALQTRNRGACELGFPKVISPEKIFTESASISSNRIHDDSSQSALISENSNPQIFTSNNKEQVNGYQHEASSEVPADDLFTFTVCHNQCFDQVVKRELQKETSETNRPFDVVEELSNTASQEMLDVQGKTSEQLRCNDKLENGNHYIPQNNSDDCSKRDTYGDAVDMTFDEKHCVENGACETELLKIRKKIIKILTPKRIPKCTMVAYSFHASERLPCFSEVFGPLVSEEQDFVGELALPKVLTWEEKYMKEKDTYIFLSDDDSESDSVDTEQKSLYEPSVKNEMKSDDTLQVDVVPEKIEMVTHNNANQLSSDFDHKTSIDEVEPMDTNPNMLTLDDELESFLVSNMVITGDQCGDNSQLPDLSENLGCILRNDNLHEETPLESVYRNMFSRAGVSIPGGEDHNWSRLERPADDTIRLQDTTDGYGNFFNAAALLCSSTERAGWQFADGLKQQHMNHGNTNAIYGNIWPRNATNGTQLNHMGGRHLTNDRIFHTATGPEPYMHGVSKNVLSLPSNVIRTNNSNFEFGSTAARVEVVDSSLNYDF